MTRPCDGLGSDAVAAAEKSYALLIGRLLRGGQELELDDQEYNFIYDCNKDETDNEANDAANEDKQNYQLEDRDGDNTNPSVSCVGSSNALAPSNEEVKVEDLY